MNKPDTELLMKGKKYSSSGLILWYLYHPTDTYPGLQVGSYN